MIQEEKLAKLIAGEIVLADEDAGATIKKWRELFQVTQKELAQKLDINPSVISDYESGRRKSPGIHVVKRIVDSLIEIDRGRGYTFLMKFGKLLTGETFSDVILDIREFMKPINAIDFFDALEAEIVACEDIIDRELYGYTLIDSIKAIMQFTPLELAKLYGSTTQRALIFTKVSTGRSPMIAIRVTMLKPSVIVIHGAEKIDSIAIKLAELERIPLGLTRLATIQDISETVDLLIKRNE